MGVMMTDLVYSEALRKSPPLASRALRHHQLAWYNAAMSKLRDLQPSWPEQPPLFEPPADDHPPTPPAEPPVLYEGKACTS
jgi:hypothetical protein